MSEAETPQIYLITPPQFELGSFSDQLATLLDTFPIACLRMAMAGEDAGAISKASDVLREICHARDVPIIMKDHIQLAQTLGFDGIHLMDAAKSVREARKSLGGDAVIGTNCGSSRDAGMVAGEAGADYISFGPIGQSELGASNLADRDIFAFWTEMVELPVVAEGAVSLELAEEFAPVTDFFALGHEIWGHAKGPKAALEEYFERIS